MKTVVNSASDYSRLYNFDGMATGNWTESAYKSFVHRIPELMPKTLHRELLRRARVFWVSP